MAPSAASAVFHRFVDFPPEDALWWKGEEGLFSAYYGEWVAGVVRVRHGCVRVEAPVTGYDETSVVVHSETCIGGSCGCRVDASFAAEAVLGPSASDGAAALVAPGGGASLSEDGGG